MQNSLFKKEDEVSQKLARTISRISVLTQTDDDGEFMRAAADVAEGFCLGEVFDRFLIPPSSERDQLDSRLFESFGRNIALLIQKPWTDPADEELKDRVLSRLDSARGGVVEKKYSRAFDDFTSILTDVVYLLFGSQTREDDFYLYAVRIEPEFGLFWQYARQLQNYGFKENEERTRVLILLGAFFLANF